jgi:hypothetical protein
MDEISSVFPKRFSCGAFALLGIWRRTGGLTALRGRLMKGSGNFFPKGTRGKNKNGNQQDQAQGCKG